jgi:hypothetical protein
MLGHVGFMAYHSRTSGWICGGPFPRGRPAPYDVVIACAERVGRGDAGSQHLSLRHHPVKKPTDAGQPGAQGDGTNPPDPPGHADLPDRKTADSRADLQQRLRGLKPGHPSSPYNGDGSLKPDPVNLRELESDFELASDANGHDANPADQDHARQDADHADQAERAENAEHADDKASEEWRAALPRLQAFWERHEERWPAEQRPPVDRSKDAPGSWRGDTGDYLSYEENLVTEQTLDRVRKAEPEVTRTMKTIEAEIPGARLVGLENCLKGEDRFKEKVAKEVCAKPDRSISQIDHYVPDAMRYTYQFDSDHYVDGYWGVCQQLRECGYAMEFSRNSWDDAQYRGINTRWQTPANQIFEVQIHTPESFSAKELTHQAYERVRSSAASDLERDALYEFQSAVTAQVAVPEGACAIPDYRKREV